jgi:hypothetical protein
LAKSTKDRLFAIIRKTADEGKYTSDTIYRHLGDGIYEFKAQTSRLYSFNDDRRIILTHGGKKPSSVVKDRDKAVRVREWYEAWKGEKQK